MLRWGRAARISSHEQPSFLIWSSVVFSSVVHRTRFFRGCNGAWCILECGEVSWWIGTFAGASLEQMSNASGSIGKWQCSEIDGSLNSRLYVTSPPILVRLRKPWKSHSWYLAIATDSTAAEGLREVRGVWWCSSSTGVGWCPCLA
jgi:hypothetical protein